MSGSESKRPRGPAPSWIALALVAAIYLVSLGSIERRGLWVVDNALKFLQTETLLRSGGREYAIPIRGTSLDPTLRLNPIAPPFSRVDGGKVYPQYSPVFALVSVLPYRWLGRNGLYVVPLLASLALLLALAAIARRELRTAGETEDAARRRAAATLLMVGLGTPIWFYSVVFWEHTAALALSIWGLYHHLRFRSGSRRSSLACGAALCALAAWFRDELYLFCLVLLVAQWLSAGRSNLRERGRDILMVGGGATLAALLPLWIFQAWAIGRPFGFHAATNFGLTGGLVEHLGQRPRVVYNLLVAAHGSPVVSLALSIPLVVLLILGGRLGTRAARRARPAVALFATLGSLVTLSSFLGPDGPMRALNESNSLFPGTPLLALALIPPPGRPEDPARAVTRWLRLLVLAYAAGYVLIAPEVATRGIHWGCRHLLLLYPLLGLPAAASAVEWVRAGGGRRALAPAPLVLAGLVSLAAQVGSVGLLRRVSRFNHAVETAVAARPETVILTSAFWIPGCLLGDFFDREVLLARTAEEYGYFIDRLAASGERRFLYLTAGEEEIPAPPVLALEDGLGFFRVRGYELSIESRP